MGKVFNPKLMAGTPLHAGGYIDDNGNVFRAKDVLENDYSDPYIYGDDEHIVANVERTAYDVCGVPIVDYFITLETGEKFALNETEYNTLIVVEE